MTKEQQQIIDAVYENYEKNAVVGDVIDSHYEPATNKWNLYNKEEFIFFIKKNDRFAKKWELKIEERELSLEERMDLSREKRRTYWNWQNWSWEEMEYHLTDVWNIPTRLITLTYKEQTITSYE